MSKKTKEHKKKTKWDKGYAATRGQTVDRPWNDLSRAWNDLSRAWTGGTAWGFIWVKNDKKSAQQRARKNLNMGKKSSANGPMSAHII